MKRALLIATGTVGGLGAILAITPPQLSSTTSIASGVPQATPTAAPSAMGNAQPTKKPAAKPTASAQPTTAPTAAQPSGATMVHLLAIQSPCAMALCK